MKKMAPLKIFNKINFYKILRFICVPLNILLILVLILDYLNKLPKSLNSIYLFYIVLIVDVWFLVLLIKKIPEYERNENSVVYISKYFFILFLVIIVINQFLKRQIIIELMPYIIGLTIAFGFLTFYASRERVEREIEDEKNEEEIAEQRRKQEFPYKFPKLNQIPVLRSIVRWMYKEGWWYSGLLIVIFLTFLFFGNIHLGEFLTVDERNWFYYFMPQFKDALLNFHLEQTYFIDKPGITIAWLLLIPNILFNINSFNYSNIHLFFYLSRFILLFLNSLLILLIYPLAKKFIRKDIALLFVILLYLNPIVIGISQIVNPDALMWSIGTIIFLSFINYLKFNNKKFLYISSIFLGIGLLTKYFFVIFLLLFPIFIYIKNFEKKENIRNFKLRVYEFIIFLFISLVIYFIFFPATWFNFDIFLNGTIKSDLSYAGISLFFIFLVLICLDIFFFKNYILEYIKKKWDVIRIINFIFYSLFLIFLFLLFLNLIPNLTFFNLQNYLIYEYDWRAKGLFFNNLLSSGYVLLLTNPLILLLGIFLSVFSILYLNFKSSIDQSCNLNLLFLIIPPFALLVGGSLSGFISISRYQSLILPQLILISSLGFYNIFRRHIKVLHFILLVLSIFVLLMVKPFYLNYENKINFNNYVINEAWGFGGYEIAQYLNTLNDSENITIWSDREGVDPFFKGKTILRWQGNPYDKNNKVDYLVLTEMGYRMVYIGRENYNRGIKNPFTEMCGETPLYDKYSEEPIKELCLYNNPNNCIKVIKT